MSLDVDIKKVCDEGLGKMIPFSFKKLGDSYLLATDTGRYAYLSPAYFKILMEQGPSGSPDLEELLISRNMMLVPRNADAVAFDKNSQLKALAERTSLHILVVTGRCNLSCLYCQASAGCASDYELDMTPVIAKKTVDTMFLSPSTQLTLEFQGGEPLLNWETVQFAIEYATEINKQVDKKLSISLVSNFLLMDEEKAKYLAGRCVSLCMSLDGPAELHDKQRGRSFEVAVRNFKKTREIYEADFPYSLPGLLPTITRNSLPYAKQIVDLYLELGINGIFIRPVTSIGRSNEKWNDLGITVKEFEPFYREVLDYMIELNKKGVFVMETQAGFMLNKILEQRGYRYVDLCSPCGATRGQMAYNYDGGIYPCDEARMVGKAGDTSFLLGQVGECSYRDLIEHPTCRAMTAASTLDSLPGCSTCVYKPYCGVCPIYQYVDCGDIYTRIHQDRRHQILEMTFDILFEKLKDKENEDIFRSWVSRGHYV